MGDWLLTLDGGATNCRAVLYQGDTVVARASGPAANAWWGVEETVQSIHSTWEAVAAQAGLSTRPEDHQVQLVAGLAGAELHSLRRALIAHLPGFQDIRILTDGYAALIGAGEGQPCTLMIVGTGSVVHRLEANGLSRIAGGWGMIAGDRGSAAWIGLETVRRWLQWEDGSRSPDGSSPLREQLNHLIGTSREARLAWLKAAKPADYGALSRWVVEAAAQGDPFSERLMQRATEEVADSLYTLLDEDAPGWVFLAGGLAETFQQRLERHHNLTVSRPRQDANYGCFLVGRGRAPEERRADDA